MKTRRLTFTEAEELFDGCIRLADMLDEHRETLGWIHDAVKHTRRYAEEGRRLLLNRRQEFAVYVVLIGSALESPMMEITRLVGIDYLGDTFVSAKKMFEDVFSSNMHERSLPDPRERVDQTEIALQNMGSDPLIGTFLREHLADLKNYRDAKDISSYAVLGISIHAIPAMLEFVFEGLRGDLNRLPDKGASVLDWSRGVVIHRLMDNGQTQEEAERQADELIDVFVQRGSSTN